MEDLWGVSSWDIVRKGESFENEGGDLGLAR